MLSKILIDVDENGFSTIKILKSTSVSPDMDVRDKLVNRFLEGGMFAVISRSGENNDAEIHSMNGVDVLDNVLHMYSGLFNDSESLKEFQQSIYKACSFIEEVSGERSSAFLKKCDSQS